MPRRRLLPKITRHKRINDETTVQTVTVNHEKLAYWNKGALVEITLFDVPGREHDPNIYWARCLTGGTFPELEVVDDNCEPHPEFKELLTKGQYVIWREI